MKILLQIVKGEDHENVSLKGTIYIAVYILQYLYYVARMKSTYIDRFSTVYESTKFIRTSCNIFLSKVQNREKCAAFICSQDYQNVP